MKQFFTNKWVILFLILFPVMIYLQFKLSPNVHDPTFIESLTNRSQYYIRELLGQNHQMYSVQLDEIKNNLNTYYLIIGLGITVLIIITIQIIATITHLPIGYLAYPGKFLVIKKSNKAQQHSTPTEKGESE